MTFVNINRAASTGIHHKPEVFMIRFFCLTLASFLALSAPASAQTVLRLNGWLPPTHPIMTRTLKPWAEEVNKVTQGRVRIEVTASSMGPPPLPRAATIFVCATTWWTWSSACTATRPSASCWLG